MVDLTTRRPPQYQDNLVISSPLKAPTFPTKISVASCCKNTKSKKKTMQNASSLLMHIMIFLILQGDPKETRWASRNFSDGSVTWKMNGANAITVTDKTGDNMVIQLDEIE